MREEVRTGLKINKLLAMRFSNEVDVSEAEVSSFMARNRDATLLPERVHARHILVAVDGKDDERARAAKRKRIEAARQEVLAGGDFAQTATKYSDCPSRRWGGDLGTFARGQKAKPLGDAAFSQEPGAVGPIVETKSGYHIVQVLDHKEAGRMPREEVAAMLRSRKQETALTAFLNELKSKATITYGDPRRRSERR
jgi:peptidyl-prolyl cis-trans isomerase C